jgi:hypothetical protein
MRNPRAIAAAIYFIMLFTLGVIGFYFYEVIFWALGALWHRLF